jgi:hypothetical protein
VDLIVDPLDGLVAQTPRLCVRGLRPGAVLCLSASTRDASGQNWTSAARFVANESGEVDLSRDAPTDGDYSGADATGPIWSMRVADTDRPPSAFAAPDDQITITFRAVWEQDQAAVTVVRRWAGEGVTQAPLRGERFVGRVYEPAASGGGTGHAHRAGSTVVLIPGSTGASVCAPWAALWASYGHRAVVAAYLGEPGLPSSLCEIPLEALDEALRRAAQLAAGGPLAVISFSVGTMGALSALALLSDVAVSAIVAIAPSHVVWQALAENGRPPETSSWSLRGEPLPWIPIRGERLLPEILRHALARRLSRRPTVTALHMLPAYAAGLTDHAAVARAAIPVERIGAPMLLISGGQDAMWPGSHMADALLRRRADAGLRDDEHLVLPQSGHFLRAPIVPSTVTWNDQLHSGGTPAGCAAGAMLAWNRMRRFVDER